MDCLNDKDERQQTSCFVLDADYKIIAINLETKEEFVIENLYWFEENGVKDFGGDGYYANYSFRLEKY